MERNKEKGRQVQEIPAWVVPRPQGEPDCTIEIMNPKSVPMLLLKTWGSLTLRTPSGMSSG